MNGRVLWNSQRASLMRGVEARDSEGGSESIEFAVALADLGGVIDDAPSDLDPGVGVEGKLAGADDHLCRDAAPAKQPRRDSGTRQAQRRLGVIDRGAFHRMA